ISGADWWPMAGADTARSGGQTVGETRPPDPSAITRALVSMRLRAADVLDTVSGRRDRLTPPRRLSTYVGQGDFRATGEEFLGLFRRLVDLRAQDRVLDIGCGIGRMARVLVPVLRPPGSYDGFDIAEPGIRWCQGRYRDTSAPFRFKHADLHNSVYNPAGRATPETYTFPYGDGSFDLAIATSVFTHLLPEAADRYLAEAARVLAPTGRLFATWFLTENVDGPPPPFKADRALAPAATTDPAAPETAVAYPEPWLREHLDANGLELDAIHRGSWRADGAGLTLQDVVIARCR
ncbi:MAG: class I SAM-dependent methyltransferase, partial [Solirubrobacteraceae bacterium]